MANSTGISSTGTVSTEAEGPGAAPTPATPTIPSEPDSTVDDPSVMLTGPGQVLPITAQATIAGETFDLEVAQTAQQQQLGLMHRKALPDHRGMLFPFSPARPVSFWMKNVPVGLDMVFLYQGQVQGIVEAPPCGADPCPTYGPGRLLVDHVIELRMGRAAELGLAAGDRVEVRYLAD
ncbi:DUF192 domain-containing protein [Leptothoe sp. PORK10 BA2]|uniref:DUF192 domain-containing protein n=1 Tax=Leptothoe sp. PORK10 BA2 TaxID=3110254 RepID=UPI002B1EFD3D|nr:DUF192 domain-containing protein [Leptothoe sp. PORK10 BA2]MEA5464735.1 DUF192 domain-containing protein [Leptothoe sp. PORK10 BA2]